MSEIAQLLQQRVGLSDDQAQEAEKVVIEFVRSKVPEQFQGILNSMLGSEAGTSSGSDAAASSGAGGELSSLLGAAEGLFSKG